MLNIDPNLEKQLTHCKEFGSPTRKVIVVRPGMALAMYYGCPLHEMADQIPALVHAYLDFIPAGSISAICGVSSWGKFSKARLDRQLKQLRSPKIDYTNVDLGSGDSPDSTGPFGWHLNGGNLSNKVSRPNNSNVIYFTFPFNAMETIGGSSLAHWVAEVARVAAFESGQFGFAFCQLQRTWTQEADDFIGKQAMRFRGLDILEPDLAREAKGLVPNCSWLNLIDARLIRKVGGESAISSITNELSIEPVGNGLMIRAGSEPVLGEINRKPDGLGAIREVARLTKPIRVAKRVLFYGSEDFRHDWVNRFDE